MRGVTILCIFMVFKPYTVYSHVLSIKQRCTYDAECPENAYCRLQTECTCKEGYFSYGQPNTNRETCLQNIYTIGDECVADVQCQLKFGNAAQCKGIEGCQCHEHAHFLHDRCYNSSKIGESCLTRDNCYINQPNIPLSCDRSICVCPQGYHSNKWGSQCIKSVRLGRPCNTTEQCTATNSICFEECRCDVHHIANNNNTICLPEVERIGDACQESVQCSKGISDSACIGGLCQCIEAFHPGTMGRFCWKTVRLGSSCTNDEQCVPKFPWDPRMNLALAICVDGTCQCVPGTSEDSSGTCAENAAKMLGPTNIILVLITIVLRISVQQFC